MVRTNFSADFWTFRIFDRNFAKIVAPPSDEYANYVVRPKEQSLLKKTLQTPSKSADKRQRNVCSNYAPLDSTLLRTRSVTNKKKQTPYFRTIFPKVCMVIKLVEAIKKVAIHFSIQRI